MMKNKRNIIKNTINLIVFESVVASISILATPPGLSSLKTFLGFNGVILFFCAMGLLIYSLERLGSWAEKGEPKPPRRNVMPHIWGCPYCRHAKNACTCGAQA